MGGEIGQREVTEWCGEDGAVELGNCEYLYYTPFLAMMFEIIKSIFLIGENLGENFRKYFFDPVDCF